MCIVINFCWISQCGLSSNVCEVAGREGFSSQIKTLKFRCLLRISESHGHSAWRASFPTSCSNQSQHWIQTSLLSSCWVTPWKPPKTEIPQHSWIICSNYLLTVVVKKLSFCATRTSPASDPCLSCFFHHLSEEAGSSLTLSLPIGTGRTALGFLKAFSPPGWTHCTRSPAEDIICKELGILTRPSLLCWALHLNPLLCVIMQMAF